jgi:hypothetical protein
MLKRYICPEANSTFMKLIRLLVLSTAVFIACLPAQAQQLISVHLEPAEIQPDEFANVIIHTHIPNLDCTTESILVFAACGAISLEMYYGAWIWPGDCYRTDTISVGPFCEGLTYFSVDMYFPDFVKTDSFDTIVRIETTTSTQRLDSGNWSVYPNPAYDRIHVTSHETDIDEVSLVITDLSGRIVFARNIVTYQGMQPLTLSGLSDGTYIYYINKADQQLSSGLLVKIR